MAEIASTLKMIAKADGHSLAKVKEADRLADLVNSARPPASGRGYVAEDFLPLRPLTTVAPNTKDTDNTVSLLRGATRDLPDHLTEEQRTEMHYLSDRLIAYARKVGT